MIVMGNAHRSRNESAHERDDDADVLSVAPPPPRPQGALVMPLMAQGFNMGLIKFNIITARKP